MPSTDVLVTEFKVIVRPRGWSWKVRLLCAIAWLLGIEREIDFDSSVTDCGDT